jgi:hypothetical protein
MWKPTHRHFDQVILRQRINIVVACYRGKNFDFQVSEIMNFWGFALTSAFQGTYHALCRFVCLSVCLCVYLSIYLSIFLPVYLSIYLFTCLLIYLSFYLSTYLSVCFIIDEPVCLFVYLHVLLNWVKYYKLFLGFNMKTTYCIVRKSSVNVGW